MKKISSTSKAKKCKFHSVTPFSNAENITYGISNSFNCIVSKKQLTLFNLYYFVLISFRNAFTLFVCAPNVDYCHVVANCVQKSLELMKHVWLDGVVAGGGIFERKMSDHFKQVSDQQQKQNRSDVMKAAVITNFANAILIFPETLKKNAPRLEGAMIVDAAAAKTAMIRSAAAMITEFLKPNPSIFKSLGMRSPPVKRN